MGAVTPRTAIQVDGMDGPLRNGLWNVITQHVFDGGPTPQDTSASWHWKLIRRVWVEFRRRPVDELNSWEPSLYGQVRDWFFKAEWYEVYDFIEFLLTSQLSQFRPSFRNDVSVVFGREMAGYRIVGDEIVAITDEQEIDAIETALDTSPVAGVRAHLNAALAMLANRRTPDYRNSIKESISAVESLCRAVTGDERATLGTALKRLEKEGVTLHPALEKAWGNLYGYTSDEEGIRHAMLEESTLTMADAKYFLVSCSAFVTYLTQLSADSGKKLG